MESHAVALVLALLAGVAVAAAAGLRAFLPLLVVGLAARFGVLDLKSELHWLSSTLALVCLGTATVVEIAADKIPVVDHVLDAVSSAVRPVAAALASFGVLVHWPSPWAQIIAVALAGGAFAIHAVKAKVRLGSTVTTAGTANPWLSVVEDVTATVLLVLALLAPLIAILLLAFGVAAVMRWAGRRRDAQLESATR